jgi:regulatory protein
MPNPNCYDKAVELLGARPHFRQELGDKLIRRGFARLEVNATLDRLTEQGYLDDGATARRFVEGRVAAKSEGRLRLRGELLQRGVAASLADAVLAELTPEDDLEAAREVAARFLRGGRKSPDSLARHLVRKGYSRRAIVELLREQPGGPEFDDADLGPDPE